MVASSVRSSKGRRLIVPRSFRQSIQDSLRAELGNLGDELEGRFVGRAHVIDIESPPPTTTTGVSSSQGGLDCSGTIFEGGESRIGPGQSVLVKPDQRTFVLSPKGLLGSVFVVFLLGAFVGAGSAILTMWSLGDGTFGI